MVKTIIVSLSNKCNLRCTGCYAYKENEHKDDEYDIVAILKAIGILIKKYNIREIVFHGGEPCLIDIKDIEEICKYVLSRNKNIKLSIQTNVTRINNEWIDLFKKYNFGVGVSYRGYKEMFEKLSGGGNYEEFYNGLIKLRDNGLLYGAIFYIPIKYSHEVEDNIEKIVDDINNLGIKTISIHEPDEKGKMENYYDIILKMQEYIYEKGYDVRIRNIYMLYSMIRRTGWSRPCSWRHDCFEYMVVDGQGRMYWCNRKPEEFKVHYKECLICPIFGLYEGGCEAIRLLNDGKFPYCEDRKKLYKYVVENLSKLYLHYDFLR